MAKLLSYKDIHLWRKPNRMRAHHIEGEDCEKELYYGDRPYMRNGVKVARRYVGGIGCQAQHEIYHLR